MSDYRHQHGAAGGRIRRTLGFLLLACGLTAIVALASTTVPTDVQIPGTQPAPTDNVPVINSVGNCNCHDFTGDLHEDSVPLFGWTGGMMANAGRDPLFWSTVAIAEQDFLPGGGGVGDLCLHCHSVKGWIEGRSTPTNGSGLDPATDGEGIMCEFCHLLTNPDQANSIPNPPEGSYHEEQNAPFEAFDPNTGEGYYGGAEYVLNSGGTRLGPYSDHGAKHDAIPSPYLRDARFCGTCHDVSNPAVGDLAPNHGSLAAFTGSFSGVVGGPVADKAAMKNQPYTYGIVERTFSEWVSSGLDTLRVNDFATLPADLKVAGGSLEDAYQSSRWGTCNTSGALCNENANCPSGQTCVAITADYQQPLVTPPAAGAPRYYTCQTCHMSAAGDHGANQGRGQTGDPYRGMIRPDLPRHDQTGMSYWVQETVIWQDDHGTLAFGSGVTADQRTAMSHAMSRSEGHLSSAATLAATQNTSQIQVRVTNLTGHKLISGYPEGRRMWLNLKWYNGGTLIHEDGAYGPLGNVVSDLQSVDRDVLSILDPSSTKVYEAKPAMTQDWAAALVSLGYDPGMVLEWDRMTNMPAYTLGDLAAQPAGTMHPSFHFVLNNSVYKDNRIPPYGFSRDEALARNCIPVPETQFGDPGAGGVYDHFDLVDYTIPAGATSVEVDLLYQATSWEYIQFLWLQNDGVDPFLGDEGVNMLDAWLNTGMAPPFEMAQTTISLTPVAFNAPGHSSELDDGPMEVTAFDAGTGAITLSYMPACDATDHTIHYGNLAGVRTYGWADAVCGIGVSGTAIFTPDPAVGESIFWVIVGTNDAYEGSYGLMPGGAERPASTVAGACAKPQSLAVVCE